MLLTRTIFLSKKVIEYVNTKVDIIAMGKLTIYFP
ncbi:hypothetical protein XBKB1_1660013 [Xenorhabdus bovienii str. kraussei Becker Underwood]|uniref:Uncharacterized protein n=1 Tax=Xenorhabdus bovienii str. kraussei Becker Underwood TaxID=1398204 RepID=A0A077PG14_XENBV|nr:hypothetical protein XBKB1_1660013 [Xenorhabdus bovienii str. kraussei Becker Underwood]